MIQKKCRKCKNEKYLQHFQKMNMGKYGVASTCNECNNSNKKVYELKKTEPKKIWKKRIQRIKDGGSEVKVFEKINKYDQKCWICDNPIKEPLSWTFPHILNKKDYPAFRVFESNIARACSIEHHDKLDKMVTFLKKDKQKIEELKKMILELKRDEIHDLFLINN